jgi:hypothetical protein
VSWYNREQKELNASMSNLHARIEALLQRLIIIGMKVEDTVCIDISFQVSRAFGIPQIIFVFH